MTRAWTLRLAVAVVLLAVAGCADDPPPNLCPPFNEPFSSVTGPGLLMVGQQATVTIRASVSLCDMANDAPTSVTAEIEGPNGEPVENRIDLNPNSALATLQFTPKRPGPHHVLVAFAQSGGLHQFDFHAVMDRSAEAQEQSYPQRCISLERTAHGAWVCDTLVTREGMTLASFFNAKLAVAGDVLWVVGFSDIRRYVDTGTELQLTATLANPEGLAEFMAATPDELVVLHSRSLARYTFQNGAIAAGYPESWIRPPTEIMSRGPYGVFVRHGDWLVLGTRSQSIERSDIQLCMYQLLSGTFRRTTEECRLLPGEIFGFEPGILWTKDLPSASPAGLNMGLIRRWVLSQGRLEEQGSLSLGTNTQALIPALMRPTAVPVLTNSSAVTAVVSWSPQRKALVLESFDPDLFSASATPTLYWGSPSTNPTGPNIRVRIRPPTP